MGILRKTFSNGRMNLDIENRLLPDGDYREATNVVVIGNESNNEGSVRKSFSTKKITNLDLGDNPICLGTYSYNARNRVYWLILSNVRACLIEYDFNNNVSSFVLNDSRPIETRVFDLKKDFFCTAINIIPHEDINKELFLMTDNNIEPLCINIERAKQYGENGFDKEDIYLIKKPPRYAPKAVLSYSIEKSNNIEEKFLRFAYRYLYLDDEWSALSCITNSKFAPNPYKIDYLSQDNLGMVNAFNAILLTVNTGDKRVKAVQVVFKEDNSNAVYVIETFKKEELNWINNSFKTFSFANNKIYAALPDKELFRSFDNVPREALAQAIIGNKVVFGNYLENFNLVNKNFKKINIDYTVSVVSEKLNTYKSLDVVVSNNTTAKNTMQITNTTVFALLKDNNLVLKIAVRNGTTQIFNENFTYTLLQNYVSLNVLFQDLDFINFISIISSVFANRNTYVLPNNNTVLTEVVFTPYVTSQNVVGIEMSALVIKDNANVTTNVFFNFSSLSTAYVTKISTSASCKSNRDFVVALQYLDTFSRKTIALTSLKNSIYIKNELSDRKNELQIRIKNPPPEFADRYKILVKTPALSYYTITVNTFFQDAGFVWIRLEGSDKDKVKEGEYLILKRTPEKVQSEVVKTKVLEVSTKDKNFIETNVGTDEPAGLYMKIKPTGFIMKFYDNKVYRSEVTESNYNGFPTCYLPMNFAGAPDNFLKAGTQITLYFDSSFDYDSGWSSHIFEKPYRLERDYTNIKDWYDEVVLNTSMPAAGDGGNYFGRVNFITNNNLDYLSVLGLESSGSEDRGGFVNARIIISASAGDYIFETEPVANYDNNFFYETEQTFDIINGNHQGDINQNISSGQDAVVKLNFFNCFSQGNGVESYMIKDGFNKAYLNIDTRPTTTSLVEYQEVRRSADLTYSESFVESSNINGLNVFNLSTGNFKDDLDKQYGSIQRIHSRENDIIVLQEDKAGKVLFGKDALFTADGDTALTGITEVLGRYIPYQGNRGIGLNPESFSIDDFGRIKYASVKNGTIVRLSNDGIEDITYGLKNFFRNLFLNNFKSKIISGYDAFLNLTFFTVGDEEQTTPIFNCDNQIIKAGQDSVFEYKLLLNNLSGDIVFTYNITQGVATIQVIFNNLVEVVSNVSGSGTIVVPRNNLIETFALVTITPVSETIDYSIINTCPLGTQLEIITVILNDAQDETKTVTNQFKSNTNPYISDNDIFTVGPVTRFESLIGLEGVGSFPVNGDLVTIESLKESTNSGKFEIGNCNKLAYLISSTVYTSSQYQQILDNPNTQFLTLAEIGETNFSSKVSGQFLFNRNSLNEKLYLIWDYTDRKPILANDSVNIFVSGNVNINVLANDTVLASAVTVTIATAPLYGTAVVNPDKTITYTHNGTENFQDSIVYQVSNGNCSSNAIITIGVGSPCTAGIGAGGNTGIYEAIIIIGTDTGITGINHEAQGVPDRFEIFYDGVKVADSKYVGDSLSGNPPSFPGLLGVKTGFNIYTYNPNNGNPTFPWDNTGNIEPNFTVTQSDIANGTTEPTAGTGTITFNKTTALPITMKIRVTGTSNTAWSLTGICPS